MSTTPKLTQARGSYGNPNSAAKEIIYSSLPAILIFSLLVNSSFFVAEFYTSLLLYSIVGSLVVILSGVLIIKQNKLVISKVAAFTVFAVILWAIYICVNNNYINPGGSRLKSTFLIISITLFIALFFYLDNLTYRKKDVFLFFSIVAGIESIWCILQFVGLIKSSDSVFKVTGTWVNPNITAMFLALTLPAIISNLVCKLKEYRKLYVSLVIVIVIALILLKCRTAMLGAVLAAICIFEWRYGIVKTFFKKSNKGIIITIAILVIIISVLIGYIAYQSKKDSADGRKLIWNLSLNTMLKKPLSGFGYGSFERVYNIEQAYYFQNYPSNEREKGNASHTLMAYNEFIENTIEGGILGGSFLFGFILLLLIAGYKYLRDSHYPSNPEFSKTQSNQAEEILMVSSLVGILVLFFMSLVNFTITAVPIMCIFIFHASIVANLSMKKSSSFAISLTLTRILAISLIVSAIIFFYKSTITAYNQAKIKSALNAAKEKDFAAALNNLKDIPMHSDVQENYHQVLGNLYYAMNNTPEALIIYQKATDYYSSPELYQQIGNCFLAASDYKQAIRNYEIAKYIQPNRFTPRYLLMRLYVELKDKANAIKLAKEIVEMDEKIPSIETASYKKIARELLIKLTKDK